MMVSDVKYARGWFIVSGTSAGIELNFEKEIGWISSDLVSWEVISIPIREWAVVGNTMVAAEELELYRSELMRRPFEVSVSNGSNASESGQLGSFLLRRTGSKLMPISVAFSIGGTAVPGTDFAPMPKEAAFGSGQDTIEIKVRPASDSLVEMAESVVLRIEPGESYDIGSPATATVWIEDSGTAPRFRPDKIERRGDGSIRLVFTAPLPGRYEIESSENLEAWKSIHLLKTQEPELQIEHSASGFQQQFYRAKFLGP